MEVKRAVVHLINKEPKKTRDQVPPYALGNLLDSSDSTLIGFAERVINAYHDKSGSYGKFEDDIVNYPFSSAFKSCYSDDVTNEIFLELSEALTKRLHTIIKDIYLASAESLVFLEYNNNQNNYLLIIILNGGVGNYIDKQNGNAITEVQSFNFRDVHHAVRINITSCLAGDFESYLHFFSKGKQDTADYFKNAVGCTRPEKSSVSVKNLKSAIKDFCSENNIDENKSMQTVSAKLGEYLDVEVTLETLANAVFPEYSTAFVSFANSENYQVPDSIVPQKKDLKIFTKIYWHKPGFSINIDRDCITDGEIGLDGDNLIIRNIPQDKLDEIRSIVQGDSADEQPQ